MNFIRFQLVLILAVFTSFAPISNAADLRQTIHLEAEFADEVKAEIELKPSSESRRKSFSPDSINSDRKLVRYLEQLKEKMKNAQISAKSSKAVLALFQSTKHFVSREVPAEIVAFYTAQFVSHLRKLTLLAPWEVEDPASLHAFFEHLFTPSGYIGFAGFMAANRLSAVPLMKLLSGIERARLTSKGPIRAKLMAGTAKLFRSIIIPSITMGAGIAVSSIIQEFWFDQDIAKCSELTLKKNKTRREHSNMKTACMAAYERWSGSNKLWEWTPQLTSLLISAQLSQTLVKSAKAGARGLRLTKVKTPSGIKKVLRTSLRGVRVFFGRNPLAFKASPIGIVLGYGIGKVIQLYVFLETINVVDHFFVRPWQTRRLSTRVLETLGKVENEFYSDWNKKVSTSNKGCESGTTSSIIANFFSHKCTFDDRDFLSLLKKFSHRLRDYRNYMLEPFFVAAKGWNHYINEFITVGIGASQVYATLGSLAQKENQLIPLAKAEFGTSLLTKSDYFFKLGGIKSQSPQPYYHFIETSLPDIETLLVESDIFIQRAKGNTSREKIKAIANLHLTKRAHFIRFNYNYMEVGRIYSPEMMVLMLMAADSNEDIMNWELTKQLKDNGIIKRDIDVNFLRFRYVTTALRNLRRIVGSDTSSYPKGLQPLAIFFAHHREFFDGFGKPTQKYVEFTDSGKTDFFLDLYSLLEEPWPLEAGEGIIYDLYQFVDSGIQSDQQYYPKSFGAISTPSLTEYLIASMACGPKPTHLNLFQRRSSWSEWFFNWFEKGNDKFVTQYQEAIRKGDTEKAYSIINKFKFSKDYSISGNIISHAFGLKEMFVPPRITVYPRGFTGAISGPAVAKYTPCRFARVDPRTSGSPRGFQQPTYNFIKKETYYGLIDVIRNQLNPKFSKSSTGVADWWEQQIDPGFKAHVHQLKSRYKAIVKQHFTLPFNSGEYYAMDTYRGKKRIRKISASKAKRMRKSNSKKSLKTLIPLGIKNSLNYEFDFFEKTLIKISKARGTQSNDPQIQKEAEKKLTDMKDQLDEISKLLGDPKKNAQFLKKFKSFNSNLLYLVGLYTNDPQMTPIEKAEAMVIEVSPDIATVGNVLADFGDTQDYKTQVLHFILSRFYQISMEMNYYQDLILTFEKRSV